MKKITIVLLAVFFIGIANVTAQTDTDATNEISAVEQLKANCPDWGTDKCPFTINEDGKIICKKSGEECSAKDLKKCCKSKKRSCCKSKKRSCSKSKNGGFNYNKSNNYGNNSGSKCNAKKVKKCGEDCTKPCCVPPPSKEETPSEE